MNEISNEFKFIELFAGVGGFRLGIEKAIPNSKCVFTNEWDKHAIQTYNSRFNENHKPIDIRTIKANELPDFDMLCGGFPCQTFSIAGKRKGFEDTRGTMFFEISRILKVKKPRLVFLENVKGLLNHDKGQTFRVILETLGELGYDVEWMVLNSKFFGVPQNRERVFIVGHLRGEPRPEILPFTTESSGTVEGSEQTPSVRTLTAGGHSGGLHSSMTLIDTRNFKGETEKRIYQDVSPTLCARARTDEAPCVVMPVLTPDRLDKRQNGRRFKDDGEEMFTLTGQDIHGIMLRDGRDNRSCLRSGRTLEVGIKGTSIRRLTPVECERLQGFPDNWTAGVSDTQRYKQMGNAVTVNVIEAIAKKLQE